MLRNATKNQQTVKMKYQAESGDVSERLIQPLGQIFWGKVWTLIAWCELRNAYHNFRVDRVIALEVLETQFATSDTKSLKHYIAQYAPPD